MSEATKANGAAAEKTELRKPDKPDQYRIILELVPKLESKLRFFYSNWYIYKAGVWLAIPIQKLRLRLRQMLPPYRARGIEISQRLVRSLAEMLEEDLFLEDDIVNACAAQRNHYINFTNGLLDLKTGELKPHNPDLFFTTQLDYAYDRNADCPIFKQTIRKWLIDPETGKTDEQSITLLLQAIIYTMTSRTDLKKAFFLVGLPDSGKSTLIGVIISLMGSLHVTLDLNQLSNRFILSGIVGKRVVTFTEANEGSVLPDAQFKSLVGGQDEIWIDVKNKPAFHYKPEAKIWWAMNKAPRILDRSGATINRILPILFNRTIPQNERNTELGELLKQERAGIVNWAMSYYLRLCREGKFTLPEQSARWLENYRLENDTEKTFLREMCEFSPEYVIQGKLLYKAYREWCIENGFAPKNSNQLKGDWERLRLTRVHKEHANYWYGAKLRNV